MSLFNALPGACAQGLIWGIMAIGVYITYKILDLADLTVDGTMATGGAVCIMMIRSGHSIGLSLLCAVLAGALAGLVTGIFHTAMGIPAILAGILTQLGLYSINLRILANSSNQAVSVDKYSLLVSLRYIKGVPFYKNTILICIVILIVLIRFTLLGFSVLSLDAPSAPPAPTRICPGHRESIRIFVKSWDLCFPTESLLLPVRFMPSIRALRM